MKKRILAALTVLCCMVWCFPIHAADLPQTIIISHYESGGEVIVSEDTLFTVMPDGCLVSPGRQEIPSVYLYGVYSALASISKKGSTALCTGALDVKRSDCTISGKLRVTRSSDERNWTTKKSKSYSTSEKKVFLTDFEYAMGYGYFYRAELDVNTINADGITVESITVVSNSIEN